MGKKIFISYKYKDENVYGRGMTVRGYVDELQELLKEEEHINKGEPDDEDLSQLEDDTIRQKLSDRMFDSTVTIVAISPGMRNPYRSERNQWIPWEVSYSLQTRTRQDVKSNRNAMIAVVLPDASDSYEYYIQEKFCRACNSTIIHYDAPFPILSENMFNAHDKERFYCKGGQHEPAYIGEHSYIASVKWDDFIADSEEHIKRALNRYSNRNNYKLHIRLDNSPTGLLA